MRSILQCGGLWLMLAQLVLLPVAAAETMKLGVMPVSAAQREAITELTARFNRRGPHRVEVVAYPHEQFKARIDELLSDRKLGLDVVVWFGGERLRRLIRSRRIQPLDDLSDVLNPEQFTESALSTVREGGQYWGVPVSYYPWGIFYQTAPQCSAYSCEAA